MSYNSKHDEELGEMPKLINKSFQKQCKIINEIKIRYKDVADREMNIRKIFNLQNYGKKLDFKKKIKLSKEEINQFLKYKDQQFKSIKSPFCNFAESLNTVFNYQNIMRYSIGNY